MATYNKNVVREAFNAAIGLRVSDTDLTRVSDEFSATYRSMRGDEAFKAAVATYAPTIDPSEVDKLFVRFESALVDAKTEADRKAADDRALKVQKLANELAAQERADERADRKAAQERADREKAEDRKEAAAEKLATKQQMENLDTELQAMLGRFNSYRRDCLSLQEEVVEVVRQAKTASKGVVDAPAVRDALGVAESISERVDTFIARLNESARIANHGVRDRIRQSVEDETTSAEEAFNSLRNLRRFADDALDNVKEAVTAAKEEKEADRKEAAIKKAVDDSAANVATIEDLVSRVAAGVDSYVEDIISQTGGDPSDNPDALIESVNEALERARAANDEVVAASNLTDKDVAKTDAENAAERVAAEKPIVEKALKDITNRSALRKRARSREESKSSFEQNKTEEKKKERDGMVRRFLSSWQGHVTVLALFVLGIAASLLFFPTWVQVGAVLTALLALGGYGFAFLKGKPESGVVAPGAHFVIVVLLLIGLAAQPLIGKGPGSDRPIIPPQPTATATPTESAESDFYEYTPTPETESGD